MFDNFDLRRWKKVGEWSRLLALEIGGENPEPPPFGTLFKPGNPRWRQGYFPIPEGTPKPLDTRALIITVLSQPNYNVHITPPTPSQPYIRMTEIRPSTATHGAADHVSTMDVLDVPMDPSHSVSDQTSDKGKTPAVAGPVDVSADKPAETHESQDANTTGVDLNVGGPSNPVSDNTPQSGSGPASTPQAEKSQYKSAFVKVMELGEDVMLIAWLQAFFDHFFFVQRSGGDLHGDISPDTIIYLEEQQKGGLLLLDPPAPMPGGDFNGYPRQRWIPEWDYDDKYEVILEEPEGGEADNGDSSPLPVDWYKNGSGVGCDSPSSSEEGESE